MRIYPDTIIWNLLCDQDIDPKKLLDSLNAKDATLTVSFHTVYELARNFQRDDPKGSARAQQLFAYLKMFLDLNMPCTKELWELIIAEAYAIENKLAEIDPMATPEQCNIVMQEVGKLANGVVEGKVKEFLKQRVRFAKDTQEQQKAHVIAREELKQHLQGVPELKLAEWIEKETFTASGVSLFYRLLAKQLGSRVTLEYALGLLRSSLGDAARGTVRADLCSNWHCANFGSNRRDLVDDMLHVLQAMYCHPYVTEERKQSKYAPLLLTPKTRVAIYSDRSISIDQWLIGLV